MATHNIKPGKHIMFSYGWDIQKIILQIHHCLTEKNVPVWMDKEGGMKDYLTNRYLVKHELKGVSKYRSKKFHPPSPQTVTDVSKGLSIVRWKTILNWY
jgi:hypothetical protein